MSKRRRKRVNAKRVFPARYAADYVSGMTPNQTVLAEYHSRNRFFDEGQQEDKERAQMARFAKLYGRTFKYEVPGPQSEDYSDPWLEVQAKVLKVINEVPVHLNICCINNNKIKLYMFFRLGKHPHFFIERNVAIDFWKISCEYADRETAMDAYMRGRITWVDHFSVPD